MYRAYGLLQSHTDFTLDEAAARLTARLPQYAVTRAGNQLTVASADWEIELALVEGPGVEAEAAAIAEKLAGPDAAGWATARRVEVWSETPDYEMDHFADYQAVIDVLRSFAGLIPVDPKEPSLL